MGKSHSWKAEVGVGGVAGKGGQLQGVPFPRRWGSGCRTARGGLVRLGLGLEGPVLTAGPHVDWTPRPRPFIAK